MLSLPGLNVGKGSIVATNGQKGELVSVLDLKGGVKIPATVLQIAAYWELERNGISEGLEFDKEGHIFSVNKKTIPSVTQVLKNEGLSYDYSWIDPFYATRGKYLHLATELYDKGTLDESTLDAEIIPSFEQYVKAKSFFPFEITGIEVRKRHETFGFAGIIDRTITGSKSYVLYLTKESFKLEEVKNIRSHLNVFLSSLNVMRWKEENL